MARQESLLKFTGKLGNVIGYRNKKDYLLRSASSVVRQTSATKRAARDFGTASKAGRLIRHALSEFLQHSYDSSLTNRLNKTLGEIVRADDGHKAGVRIPVAANMQSLRGFRFNHHTGIEHLLGGNPVVGNNDDGGISISFPETVINNNKATHIIIKAIALSVNFTQQTTRQLSSETVVIRYGEKQILPTLTLNPGRKDITLLMLEIQSCYEVNGQLYQCQNRKGSALDIIAILPPAEQPKEIKRKYRNKAPKLRVIPSYVQPARRSGNILPVAFCSLPEG
ncbi:hypothetical protein SAMN05518672_1011028 [Chitinophaga sp. CF118]|uniref:hypothetical protein n=1 Tax=Chitinophaga sp. CF118 TaxID=1884367 RepID=UPI0008F39487|nr:hypothetical protein [Chitinophaga sp. CF118]SFD20412.1 hypothetical protein SAMN05518672_1011028 [Chitinophaga sp. CF118]